MDEELKKAYLSWADKGASMLNTISVFQTFYETDQALVEYEKELNKVGLGTGYTSKLARLDKLAEDRAVLLAYVRTLPDYAETIIDKPLCENLRLNATERISRIRLEDFEVTNTLGITQTVDVARNGMTITMKKAKLTFVDFIGTAEETPVTGSDLFGVSNGKIPEFSTIFEARYEAFKAMGMVEEGVTGKEFWEEFMKQGEFYHDGSTILGSFISSVLDITIIKPIPQGIISRNMMKLQEVWYVMCGTMLCSWRRSIKRLLTFFQGLGVP